MIRKAWQWAVTLSALTVIACVVVLMAVSSAGADVIYDVELPKPLTVEGC